MELERKIDEAMEWTVNNTEEVGKTFTKKTKIWNVNEIKKLTAEQ